MIDWTFIAGAIHPYPSFLFLQILEAFSGDDSVFVRNCSQLISQSDRVVTMPQYEFRHICDTKLESIRRRISSYQQVLKYPWTSSHIHSTHYVERCILLLIIIFRNKVSLFARGRNKSDLVSQTHWAVHMICWAFRKKKTWKAFQWIECVFHVIFHYTVMFRL